jgi:hypothetical protein
MPVASVPQHAPDDAERRIRAFAAAIGVRCEGATEPSCLAGDLEHGDYFEVALDPDCGASDFNARVGAPTELRDRITPLDTRTVAVARPTDRLCIQATGSIKDHPEYYYVVMQPRGRGCANAPAPRTPDAECRSGWIDAEAIGGTN